MTLSEVRKCLACGDEVEKKRTVKYSLPHANCSGQLIKKRHYEQKSV